METQKFNDLFLAAYQQEHTDPTNPENKFDVTPAPTPTKLAQLLAASVTPMSEVKDEARLMVFGQNIADFIAELYPDGVPTGSRHKSALCLAYDLLVMLDGNKQLAAQALKRINWVQDIINERGEREIDDIVSAADKKLKKRESETFSYPRPSPQMRAAIERLTHRKYSQLVSTIQAQDGTEGADIVRILERMGRRIERLFPYYPLLRLFCHGLQRKHYVAAMFVGSAFAMNLMTRMWYRFWPAPGQHCRLNHLLELIGRLGSQKRFAVGLYEIMMRPIEQADKPQVDALNRWKAERAQNNGAAKNKTPEPKGIYRRLPAESSAAAVRDAELNARETIDGEEIYLHISQFDTELQNTLDQMKKSHFSALYTLWLKAFHNEPHGALLKSATSVVGEWPVHYNAVYTGTKHALDQQVNIRNYATGLPTRITAVPMADSNYEMMENKEYTDDDRQRDEQLQEWAYRLDNTKGEIPCKDISDALYQWTSRRMDDARENQSMADEDLLKRPCWHAINFALPLIVSRHWDMMQADTDGRMTCSSQFATDKTDRQLALLIADAQYTFQQYFFGSIAEQHYDDQQIKDASQHKHQKATILAFRRLPDPFTSDDVRREYHYDSTGSVCSRLKHLVDDGLAKRIRSGADKGKYRKLS